ncbi:YybH family protein [Pseudomonas sp. SDO528_S397]
MTFDINGESSSQVHVKNQTPLALILNLIDARARHDVDSALACYESSAVVVDQSGKVSTGALVIKAFTETVMKLPLVFTHRNIVQAHNVAIHYSHWTISVSREDGETTELTGRTTDVLRKQLDGRWLISIDNPYGTAILDAIPT